MFAEFFGRSTGFINFAVIKSMNILAEHIEYLLQRHDCVTLPGIGSFLVRYRPAHFDAADPMLLLPPSREVVFNGELRDSDGLLERSVGRRNGVSFEAARRLVAEEAESLFHQLREFSSLTIGRIGELSVTPHGTISFAPGVISGWDNYYYGLRPVSLAALAETAAQHTAPSVTSRMNVLSAPQTWQEEEPVETRSRVGRALLGVAASLAVIVTLALFFINPIKVSNEPVKASLAPSESVVESSETVNPNSDEVPTADESEAAMSEMSASSAISASSVASEIETPVEVTTFSTSIRESSEAAVRESSEAANHISDNDKYCVIIASFPEEEQARRYVAENSGRHLGVLNRDGKYRVYAATGATYAEAEAAKSRTGFSDAWICRR